MKVVLLVCGLMLALFPSAIKADETFSVTRNSAIAFGHGDGDTFGLDEIQTDVVAVLIRPQGEQCTLRFLLLRGEKLRLRAVGTQGELLMCEATSDICRRSGSPLHGALLGAGDRRIRAQVPAADLG